MRDRMKVYVVSEAHTYRDENDNTQVDTYGDAVKDMRTARKILRSLIWEAIEGYYEGSGIERHEIDHMVCMVLKGENRTAHTFSWESGWDMWQWRICPTEI